MTTLTGTQEQEKLRQLRSRCDQVKISGHAFLEASRALDRDLDLNPARALARARDLAPALALARDLALDLDRALALALARDLDLDLDRALALARDLDLARARARDLDPALDLARDLARKDLFDVLRRIEALSGRLMEAAVAPSDAAPERVAMYRPSRVALSVCGLAARALSPGARALFAEELQDEIYAKADSGAGWRLQLGCAVRQLSSVRRLRVTARVMRSQHARAAAASAGLEGE